MQPLILLYIFRHDIIEPRTPEDVFVAPGKQSIGTGDYCALLPDLKSSGAEAEA